MERHVAGGRTLSRFSEAWVEHMGRQAPASIGWFVWAGFAGLTVLAALVLQSSV